MKTSLIIIIIIIIIISFLLIRYNLESFQCDEPKIHPWRGVNRSNINNTEDNWYGSWIYPSSANCSCPDNYDFIDTMCVSRNSPFERIYPNCYI